MLNFKPTKPKTKLSAKRKVDKFGYAARAIRGSTGDLNKNLKRRAESKCGKSEMELHLAKFPAMRLHPNITIQCINHWMKTARGYLPSKFGKNQVLFTNREGGNWQKWPWNWVPNTQDLANGLLDWEETIAARNKMPVQHPTSSKHKGIYIHSILVNGKRWDCINGWTQ